MDRREFLQAVSASTAATCVQPAFSFGEGGSAQEPSLPRALPGYTYLAAFKYKESAWKVYEDLRRRDGDVVLVSESGQWVRLPKTAEATVPNEVAPYLGLTLGEIVDSAPDLLAQRILSRGGDPDEGLVASAVPPLGWPPPTLPQSVEAAVGAAMFGCSTFIATKESWDTQPVTPDGSTLTFFVTHYCADIGSVFFPDGGELWKQVIDGLVGGWLPVIRKIFPIDEVSYWETLVFPDVERRDRFIVHTWHRIALIENGKFAKVFYGHSYVPFKPIRVEPTPEAFYRALLASTVYWGDHLQEFRELVLPRRDWADMAKHAFVKELMARPGGVYPKYGVLDRVYGGSEHDGFPDTFTNAVLANLEWGRASAAKAFIENYFDEFVDEAGAVNYRGPEVGQYGLILSLLARYTRYTEDDSVVLKYQDKLWAIARLLMELHDDSLKLPVSGPGYGLIHGWSEADSCFQLDPERYWKPYFGNTALAIRGFRDLASTWSELSPRSGHSEFAARARQLVSRSRQLEQALISSLEGSLNRERSPAYLPPFPGAKHDFDEGHPETFGAVRSYLELLQADVLPAGLSAAVIDCLREYGGTTLGVPGSRDIKAQERSLSGFLSYSYAQSLLRLGRAEEFLLFLYSHRYHVHQRGHWTAREAAGISRRTDTYLDPYCTPAQQAVPLLIRWMLVLEDSNEDRVYLGRGVPRSWLGSGQEISIKQAPTRWGEVTLTLSANPAGNTVHGIVDLTRARAPREFELNFRIPDGRRLSRVTVNNQPAALTGPRREAILVKSEADEVFEVVGWYE